MLPSIAVSAAPASSISDDASVFARRTAVFLLIGVALYAATYAGAEALVRRYGRRNPFFAIATAPRHRYDYLVLGASHAAALNYDNMNGRLEALTGATILNVSMAGAGVVVNRLMLEYFLVKHEAAAVVYIVDSFGFYSSQWNEDRMNDARLFDRAPFDPALTRLLLRRPAWRRMALEYAIGFSKINNRDRFIPDVTEAEASRFDRSYRPVRQIDEQRVEYLYPKTPDPPSEARYLAEFDDLVRDVRARGMRFLAIKPPIPDRIYRLLPAEAQFDAALRHILERNGVELHDLSLVDNDPRFFFDTDHLNRAGVAHFFEAQLKGILAVGGR